MNRGMGVDASLSVRDEGLSAYRQRYIRQGALGVFLRAVEDNEVPADSNLSAFLWARRLNNALSTRLGESFTEQDSKLVHC
ncbi:hypothetical protein [Burkholderia sp. BE17]|uniref:hypothetical protein n=1 Tax=Burkholderia sp. BE17 TaxID=2656644 RepID=UPI00128B8F46|nr:hypothetical protein [Burkholderia sp. BE17]MPV70627.1 hypothetical protein [Burkholderia sp. BE17]